MTDDVDVHSLALEKVGRILGPARATSLLSAFLAAFPRRERLASAEDLYAFGRNLSAMDGMEHAVGALLTIQAVILGAPGDAAGEPGAPGSSGNSGSYGRKL